MRNSKSIPKNSNVVTSEGNSSSEVTTIDPNLVSKNNDNNPQVADSLTDSMIVEEEHLKTPKVDEPVIKVAPVIVQKPEPVIKYIQDTIYELDSTKISRWKLKKSN